MNQNELFAVLEETLEDYKFSRSERKALQDVMDQVSQTKMGVVRSQIFKLARQATVDPETNGVIDWLEDVTKLLQQDQGPPPSDRSEALFSKKDDCSRRICTLFAMAKASVDVCVFTVTDNEIFRAIVDAQERGVTIRLITDDEKASDEGSDVRDLIRQGISVRTDQTPDHMHHKYAIFDSKKLLTGSYNWTRSAATRNEENLVISDNLELVQQFENHFNQLWKSYS